MINFGKLYEYLCFQETLAFPDVFDYFSSMCVPWVSIYLQALHYWNCECSLFSVLLFSLHSQSARLGQCEPNETILAFLELFPLLCASFQKWLEVCPRL
jgi:hypothetical protein